MTQQLYSYLTNNVFSILVIILSFVLFLVIISKLYGKTISNGQSNYREHFITGFKGAGMPAFWGSFASTWIAFVIRTLGFLCFFISRLSSANPFILTDYLEPYNLITFVFIMSIAYSVYITVFSFGNVYSILKFLITGSFLDIGSPSQIVFCVLPGATAKLLMNTVGGVLAFAAGSLAVDEFQSNVFRATNDQLLTSHFRNAVDHAKVATGWTSQQPTPTPTPTSTSK